MRIFFVTTTRSYGAPVYCKFNQCGIIEGTFYTRDDATAFTCYEAACWVRDFAQSQTVHELEVISHDGW